MDDLARPCSRPLPRARGGALTAPGLDGVWRVLDGWVGTGRLPGYAAAVRICGHVELHVGGAAALGGPAVDGSTLFRLASVTKPFGGALALALVEDGLLALDDAVARWLPELAAPRVLVAPDAPLERTVVARGPITVRHLLTLTCGWGAVLEDTPLRAELVARGVQPTVLPPPLDGDEFVARLAGVPLAFHPGEGWLYHTGIDLLGVLLERAAGRPLPALVEERLARPLGLRSTGFHAADPSRLATAYAPTPQGLEAIDPPDGLFATPPLFPRLGAGLVSTAEDVLHFLCAIADGGDGVLTPASAALLRADALTPAQRRQALPVVGDGASWALGAGVDVEGVHPWQAPGRWGWNGGTGTTAWADPVRDAVAVLLTQRLLTGPQDGFEDFWSAVAAAAEA